MAEWNVKKVAFRQIKAYTITVCCCFIAIYAWATVFWTKCIAEMEKRV